MKQFAALILLSLFLCTQYSRQLAYLDCKLDNISNSSKPTCDCEQQFGSTQDQDNPDIPAHKNHHHVTIDDYCLNENKSTSCFYYSSSLHYPELMIHFSSLDFNNVFQPPKI